MMAVIESKGNKVNTTILNNWGPYVIKTYNSNELSFMSLKYLIISCIRFVLNHSVVLTLLSCHPVTYISQIHVTCHYICQT